ncbi:hypothetical protein Hanom_Chr05g00403801 [Helianthus anomalus]
MYSFCQGTMASSASSGMYDNHDYMDISLDDEPVVEIIFSNDSSDDSDPEEDPDYLSDDFKHFVEDGQAHLSLLDHPNIVVPLEDDVLAVGLQLNDFVIVGHPEGEHIFEFIP